MKSIAKRLFSVIICIISLCLCVAALSSCSKKADEGSVYYLNFKPEQNTAWLELAKQYTNQTGIKVTVLTAASGEYESTLTSEISKSNAPTLFQVNGPVGLSNWSDYCLDLSDSNVYAQLTSDEFALKQDGKVLGIAYVIESYGLIYNKTLLGKYFAADWSSIKSIADINSFEKLKTAAEEIQTHKDELDIDGAFTSSGMEGSSDWRFKTHLANIPLYYEYNDKNITSSEKIDGTYLEQYKNIWDLYINNATCEKSQIATKTGNDASAEFSKGRAVFYQNGTWAVSDVTGEGKLSSDEIGMLPIYIGVKGEENQGLCTGSENYWCVNKEASDADIKATLDFLEWIVTSEEGTSAFADKMGFTSPFKNAKPSSNPLITDAQNYIEQGKTPVGWVFSTMPSEGWKNGVGGALTAYAEGRGDWNAVKNAFVKGWESEFKQNN